MQPIKLIRSKTLVMPASNVDTDQIIPARFLTATTREGFGQHLFADWRYRADGSPNPDFILNQPAAAGAAILVAGRNFGCGSSREHAAWALVDHGFRAVVSTEFADIFRSNALKNGLLPIVVDETAHAGLLAAPGAELIVDLAARTLRLPDGRLVQFPIDAFNRYCLLNGIDELGYLEGKLGEIERFEAQHVVD